TYTVRDNQGSESQPATVSVLVRNNAAPVISAIASRELNIGTSSGPIAFTVTDTDGDNLTVTATAADSSIVRTVAVTGTGSNRQLAITAGDFAGLTSITISVSDGFNGPVTRTVPVSVFALIDAGAATPTAGALSDRGFQNGAGSRFVGTVPVKTTPGSIAASVPDQFYRTILYDEAGGGDLGFDVKAKAGQTFAVDLFFAEVWNGIQGNGQRVFNVLLDGDKVLENFDVFREANGRNKGISRRFIIQSDGNIDIDLRRLVQNPAIAGLRVTPVPQSEA
ncbi:MAG: malectin domain-containing carbohydrate-binding protein, partial [Planctomycetaceae bacterium]